MYLPAHSKVSVKVPLLMLLGVILGAATLWTVVVLALYLADHPPSFLTGQGWPRVPFAAPDAPLWWQEAYEYLTAATLRLATALRGDVHSIEDCELGPLPSPSAGVTPPASSSSAIDAPSASSAAPDIANVLIVKNAETYQNSPHGFVVPPDHTVQGVSATNTGRAPWDLFAAATPSSSSVFEGTAEATAGERQMGTGVAY